MTRARLHPNLATRRPWPRVRVGPCAGLLLAAVVGPVGAAPVSLERDGPALPDASELAVQWTVARTSVLASPLPLTPLVPMPAAEAPARPLAGAPVPAGAPDPVAYALLGLGLVGVGLLARRAASRQRGFSKKT